MSVDVTNSSEPIANSGGAGDPQSAPAGGWTLQHIISHLTRLDSSWGAGANVTFSFTTVLPSYYDGNDSESAGYSSFTGTQAVYARFALSLWADVANVTFTEVAANSGTITFQNSSSVNPAESAHAYFAHPTDPKGGDVWVNSANAANLSPLIGNHAFESLVHEIGHTLGLPHPGDYNAGNGNPTYADADYVQDTKMYTIMSYWSETNTGGNFNGKEPQTPMLHDIAAIQSKYGANMAVRNTDTTYGFNVSGTANPIYDFTQNGTPVMCIWDGGGNDTIDLSGWSAGQVLTLISGHFSSIAGMTYNFSIAYGATIENAIGGTGNDTITGNGVANYLNGLQGNDIIYGNGGNDIIYGHQGIDQLHGGAGTDLLLGGPGGDHMWGDGGNDRMSGFVGNDMMHGGSGSDAMSAELGNDQLWGDGGNDRMFGGAGNDMMWGGVGNDYVDGGPGSDTMYGGAGNDFMQGGGGFDRMYGDAGSDRMFGAELSDTMFGGDGNDTMHGGTEVDYVHGQNDDDWLFGDQGDDNLFGEGGNDLLFGQWGNDTMWGGAGNDTLTGWAGNDTYNGGLGADRFVWDNTVDGTDTVTDYSYAQGDLLDVGGAVGGYTFTQVGANVQIFDSGHNLALILQNYTLSDGLALV